MDYLGFCPDCGTGSLERFNGHRAVCTPCSGSGGTVKTFPIAEVNDNVVKLSDHQVTQELNGFMRAHNTVSAVQVFGA